MCQPLSLDQIKALPPIPSGYSTDRVYQLTRRGGAGMHWMLREKRLPRALHKAYDTGLADDWLRSYEDAGPVEELSFLGARRGGEIAGLLTWRAVGWNDTLWLVDVRVREAERRTGVGSALIRALDRIAREERVRGIFVETQIANYPAVRFYQAHGFTISGFNDHLYTNDDLELQDVALFLFLETAS